MKRGRAGEFNSIGQPQTIEQFTKPRVRAQAVEHWFFFEEDKACVFILISLFKPFESLLFLSQSCIDYCYITKSPMIVFILFFQLSKDFPRLIFLP